MKQPFRSRPRVRPRQEPTPPEDDDQIVEGVIEEQHNQLVPVPDLPPHAQAPRQGRRAKSSRRKLPQVGVSEPGLLLIALGLMAAGIFFTYLNVIENPDPALEWWPAVSLFVSMMWSMVALTRRNATAFLGGAGAAGLSISLLLHTQDVAEFQETVVGVILISIGLAIIVRGLLLRPRVTT